MVSKAMADKKQRAYTCPYDGSGNVLCDNYKWSGTECETCGWVPGIAKRRLNAIRKKGKAVEHHEQEKG